MIPVLLNDTTLTPRQQKIILFLGRIKGACCYKELGFIFNNHRNNFHTEIKPLIRGSIIIRTDRRQGKIKKSYYELSIDAGMNVFYGLEEYNKKLKKK